MRDDKIGFGLIIEPFGVSWNAWMDPTISTDANLDFPLIQRIASSAERGRFAFVFVADTPAAHPDDRPYYLSRFEPISLISALAAVTRNVGIVATVSTSFSQPYTVARQVLSADVLSGGRVGWNVVTSPHGAAFENHGGAEVAGHDQRYAVASEFVDVAKGLWDSYDDDAFPKDRSTGVYLDSSKMHYLDHAGEHFRVRGPLNISRSPQGHPVIFQAGSSEVGRDLAARVADATFAMRSDIEDAQRYYADIKARAEGFGRDRDEIRVFQGIFPVVGRTEEEAVEKLERIQSYFDDAEALKALSYYYNRFDFSGFDLDAPFPDMREHGAATFRSITEDIQAEAVREDLSLREVARRAAAPKTELVGTAEQIADVLQEWFLTRAADGFLINNWLEPSGIDDFVELVVPILQKRGLYPLEYPGNTLRDYLGVPHPASRYKTDSPVEMESTR